MVISMGERDVIQEARTKIETLQTDFSKGFTPVQMPFDLRKI